MGKNKKQKILKNKCNWPVNIRKNVQYGKNFTHNAKIKQIIPNGKNVEQLKLSYITDGNVTWFGCGK